MVNILICLVAQWWNKNWEMHQNIVKYGYTLFRIKVFLNSACLLTQTWSGLNKPKETKNRLTLICMEKKVDSWTWRSMWTVISVE
jgi:hypothetical protein